MYIVNCLIVNSLLPLQPIWLIATSQKIKEVRPGSGKN